MEKAESKSTVPSKPYQTWSREISRKGMTERIEVCEAENGFIVTHSKYGRKEGSKNDEYVSETRKYVSKENPLEEEEEKSFADSINDILKEIAESEGMVEVKD